ncbi:S41 family peptidase [Chitinophaga arvensicola]|uniref:C-terminal processing protease CtpA/Prc, contains a PDZ domain n=1 Tax=Chitinophaga arvensicola TaxID=29529 RepID=A0A1I0P911_9BACT|nr:S41 family peptidase [Chitinophaga arvensicola]SEW10588.1 C-terminal processing protease CtpA/Prc, contains a PDZ domain [Chitinophaga arvensicola]
MQPNYFYHTLLTGLVLIFLLPACKKNDTPARNRGGDGSATTGTINDSIFFIAKDIYLWNDALPDSATFKPNSYATPDKMFAALALYKKDAAGQPLDRYSFVDNGGTSRALQQGIVGDVGFEVGFQTDSTLFIVYVYPGSPADKAGLKRGWQLLSVNGTSRFLVNDDATNNLLNNAFGSASATWNFRKPDNTTQQYTLQAVEYKLNPILYSHLYDFSGTKIGYIVFNNFVSLADVKPTFDSIFDAYTKAGVKQVILDLRYNGGGLLETAEYLANKLVPATKTNTEMYSQYFNNNVNTNNYGPYFRNMKAVPYYPNVNWTDIFNSEATTYKTARFQKDGGLALDKVTFLGTYNTVSASELLYNVLRPVMTTRLVGSTTYGKPVGFINISFSKYDMYAVNFQTKNSAGQGDYFSGLVPDIKVQDDYTTDWGTLSDPLLRSALTDMGVPAGALGRMAKMNENRRAFTPANRLQATKFKGMLQTIRK